VWLLLCSLSVGDIGVMLILRLLSRLCIFVRGCDEHWRYLRANKCLAGCLLSVGGIVIDSGADWCVVLVMLSWSKL